MFFGKNEAHKSCGLSCRLEDYFLVVGYENITMRVERTEKMIKGIETMETAK